MYRLRIYVFTSSSFGIWRWLQRFTQTEISEASDRKSGPMDAWKPAGCMVCHRPRCRDVLPLLHLWPNEPKSVHLDILDRRSNISNRRLSCEKLLASGQETVTDGTTLWGYGLVKLTSYSHTSHSHSCCGSCSYTIWSLFWEGKSVLWPV